MALRSAGAVRGEVTAIRGFARNDTRGAARLRVQLDRAGTGAVRHDIFIIDAKSVSKRLRMAAVLPNLFSSFSRVENSGLHAVLRSEFIIFKFGTWSVGTRESESARGQLVSAASWKEAASRLLLSLTLLHNG